ncbi:lasso peptide biosynthesis B2 protein [Pseudofrankia asymbiotica]|uniref:lasso peptide biosynthesis B2 protein n=1 Tax=Pseudofrankia asymbiotica TaxID=1834516 RepID=UPI001F52804D|nr:lasso peptide biosynthesis B2 protein [Pseudofrankia asymbiotica]
MTMTTPMSPRRRPPAPLLPRRLRAYLAVAAARALATQPPARIRAVLATTSRGAEAASRQRAQTARDDVTAVSMVCRGSRGCVPRSVATALLCRMSGTWPTWCVGVRTVAPFAAHAWVEAEGLMVGEDVPAGCFRPLLTVEPRRPARSGARVTTVASGPASPAAVPMAGAVRPPNGAPAGPAGRAGPAGPATSTGPAGPPTGGLPAAAR